MNQTATSKADRLLQGAFFFCAAIAIAASLLGDGHAIARWLHYLTKPTATLLLLVLVLRNVNAAHRSYALSIALGLGFAAAGDFFLMLPGDYFLFGLVCFLLTHCAYIHALTRDARLAARWPVFLLFAIVALAMVAGLWAAVPATMRLPVAAYAAVLAIMAAQAISRAIDLPPGTPARAGVRLAAVGGVLFMTSDTILAYGRFRWSIPGGALWVLGTYYAAQWLFARSTLKGLGKTPSLKREHS